MSHKLESTFVALIGLFVQLLCLKIENSLVYDWSEHYLIQLTTCIHALIDRTLKANFSTHVLVIRWVVHL